MKAIKTKSLMSLIYIALLSIPLVSILSRVIYVQANKNAYQSYSYNVIENVSQIDSNTFVADTLYTYQYSQPQTQNGSRTEFSYISLTATDLNLSQEYYDSLTHVLLSNDNKIYFSNSDNSMRWNYNLTENIFKSFAMKTSYQNGLTETFKVMLATYEENKLDNVFEYSVSRLVDENNFGELNFFEWFTSFLLNDHQQNMLYVRFANWYLCYAMLISLMQILFLCLMWFVNFSRKLLDRGMNYDW